MQKGDMGKLPLMVNNTPINPWIHTIKQQMYANIYFKTKDFWFVFVQCTKDPISSVKPKRRKENKINLSIPEYPLSISASSDPLYLGTSSIYQTIKTYIIIFQENSLYFLLMEKIIAFLCLWTLSWSILLNGKMLECTQKYFIIY